MYRGLCTLINLGHFQSYHWVPWWEQFTLQLVSFLFCRIDELKLRQGKTIRGLETLLAQVWLKEKNNNNSDKEWKYLNEILILPEKSVFRAVNNWRLNKTYLEVEGWSGFSLVTGHLCDYALNTAGFRLKWQMSWLKPWRLKWRKLVTAWYVGYIPSDQVEINSSASLPWYHQFYNPWKQKYKHWNMAL